MKGLRYLLLALLLLNFTSGYSQKSYAFDYVMEYEIEHITANGSQKYSHYCFMSSTDSSYMMMVTESDGEVGMRLVLDGGKYYYGTIAKEDFFVEAISLKCPASGTIAETERLKDFAVMPKSDTIINAQPFSRIMLQPVNKRKIENHEIFSKCHIMDNSLYLNFPSLPPDDIAYRLWKDGEKIPNGFLRECIVTDESGKVVTHTRLVQFIKLKKLIMVDKNCK